MNILRYLILGLLTPALVPAQTTTPAADEITEKSALDFLMTDLHAKDAANVTQEQIQKNVRLALQARDRAS